MATDKKRQALYDSTEYQAWSRLRAELFQSDLVSPTDVDIKDVRFARRVTVYRFMLLLMVASVSLIAVENLLLAPITAPITWVALAAAGLLIATTVWLFQNGKVLLPPLFSLTINLVMVLWAIAQGADHHILWLFPLMIALAGLLPTGVALVMGTLVILVMLALHGMHGAADDIAQTTALIATWIISLAVMRLMSRQADELADLALSDPLTGAYNRRYLQPQTQRNIADYQRYARLSAMLMIDIDHFKKINDTLGHAIGDRVLKDMVALIDNRIRGVDMVFRLGGEEFVVLLAEVGSQTATKIAEELRINIAKQVLIPNHEVTVSIGVCDVSSVSSAEDWLVQVDQAMYIAKEQGRNRVHTVMPAKTTDALLSSTLPIWR